MTEPTVCAIMLTRDRPEMARQAVRSFRAQTYEKKHMIIYNQNTAVEYGYIPGVPEALQDDRRVAEVPAGYRGLTIGAARNAAIEHARMADIIIHWDDDDLSHPKRIAEQVAMLQSSAAECVGYNEVLFWDQRKTDGGGIAGAWWRGTAGEAWLYSVRNPAWVIGSSMCYWRETWARHPFPDLPKAKDGSSEDVVWRREVKCCGVSAVQDEPRLICRIHGANTMSYEIEKYPDTWQRMPQWDAAVRAIVEAA